jgi:hypothetical protein
MVMRYVSIAVRSHEKHLAFKLGDTDGAGKIVATRLSVVLKTQRLLPPATVVYRTLVSV